MNHIIIERNIEKGLKAFFETSKYSKIVVIADEDTSKLCYEKQNLNSILPVHTLIIIKSGEEHKNLETCQNIWQKMTELELDRKSLVINLGGGVIGDMGGFCASTYKRGIDFIQIPTTLLAMVDASVGGKLGIDFNGFKNHIGVFCVPKAVIISADFLQTLPFAELRSGFAEVIKHCLIADKNKWKQLRNSTWTNLDFEDIIKHSIQIKDRITTEDPTEKGKRKVLNFGHTLGHAIETFYLDTNLKLLHGEAIAAGMICEAYLSYLRRNITDIEFNEIKDFIKDIYGVRKIEETAFEEILKNTRQDKKNEFQKVLFSIIGPTGDCMFDIPVEEEEMLTALKFYNTLC